MALFWYPEIETKYDFDGKPDKAMLLSSYISYYLARLQSMFKYDGLPDSVPAKWLETILMTKGYGVWIMNGDELLFTGDVGIGGQPDAYHIPKECIVTNPYIPAEYGNKTYKRDVDCVLMRNDTYSQGLLPMIKKYCAMLVENEITMNIADQLARATITISAVDDETKASAELWLKRLREGNLGIIGEAPFMVGNQDKALNINQLVNVAGTMTDLIEYQQYIKASLYNDLGLQSNYNMKRESINSNESQLNDDMLHPLIDTMLKERQEALDQVNSMFGTNISVEFDSAWKINEEEEQLAIEQMEAAAAMPDEELPEEEGETQDIEETPEATEEDTQDVEELSTEEVTLSEETIDAIVEEVADKLEGEDKEEKTNDEEDK